MTEDGGDKNCEDNPTLIVISPLGNGRHFILKIHNLLIVCLLVNFNKHVLQFLYLSSVL